MQSIMQSKYFRQYHADIITDNVAVTFYRLFQDEKHIMSDDPRTNWVEKDYFRVYIQELDTVYDVEIVFDQDIEYQISHKKVISKRESCFNGDKRFANNMYRLAKMQDDFNTLVKAAKVLLV